MDKMDLPTLHKGDEIFFTIPHDSGRISYYLGQLLLLEEGRPGQTYLHALISKARTDTDKVGSCICGYVYKRIWSGWNSELKVDEYIPEPEHDQPCERHLQGSLVEAAFALHTISSLELRRSAVDAAPNKRGRK